jgi:hypothetical protein
VKAVKTPHYTIDITKSGKQIPVGLSLKQGIK